MFRALPMRRFRLVILAQQERTVLKGLATLGAAELSRVPASPQMMTPQGSGDSEALQACNDLVTRISELRRDLEVPAPRTLPCTPPEQPLDEAKLRLAGLEERASLLLRECQRLQSRLEDVTKVCDTLCAYRGTGLPLDGADRLGFLHFVTGCLPPAKLEELRRQVSRSVVLVPDSLGAGQHLVAITTRDSAQDLERLLTQVGFEPKPLPVCQGATVDDLATARLSEQSTTRSELRDAEERLRRFATEAAPQLSGIEQSIQAEHSLLMAESCFARTDTTVLITGWMPAHDLEALEQHVKQWTQGHCVFESHGPEGLPPEQIPVLLSYPRIFRPFGQLVKAYGLPNYQEVEPTLFVALSYLLMFGVMFGDVGHGAVLALAGAGFWFCSHNAKLRDTGVLLFLGGLASLVFGILYGSCFGLPGLKQYALWHDPLEADPVLLITGAIRFGVAMISLGLILNIINRFRRKDFVGGLFDKYGLVGLLFYWGMLLLITKYDAFQRLGLMKPALLLFLILPVLGWSLKQPLDIVRSPRTETAQGLGAAFAESIISGFEAILSYLANTISFVRLAAYAMSHSALLLAGFVMAAELKHLTFGGIALSALVIIGANLAALVLEGVIASVQALRLEYYEFFGKFFAGNGRAFQPFRLNGGTV